MQKDKKLNSELSFKTVSKQEVRFSKSPISRSLAWLT